MSVEIREPRDLPSVGMLLDELATDGGREVLVRAIREVLGEARVELLSGIALTRDQLLRRIESRVASSLEPWPRKVINATGVVLHTNVGRAPLSRDAEQAMLEAAAYSDLEMDLDSGERSHRDIHVAGLLTAITGAEAATVVNNCAGALVLTLSALARGREVVVSRGHAVEIGGRFRIPDVLLQSGAVLREVGTTNRTYASDYQEAITDQTALLLEVHRSNFSMSGFVADVTVQELAAIARERGVRVVHDLGSGALIDTAMFGLPHEPMVQESVTAGADVTVFSGDKLLGGPQAGVIVGRADLVSAIRRHPLARAFRCDKVTLAALHATLMHYRRSEAPQEVPTLWMLGRSRDELLGVVHRLVSELPTRGVTAVLVDSAVGGGSMPSGRLPSAALAIDPHAYDWSADELARRLRLSRPPVIARIDDGEVLLDPRAVLPEEESGLLGTLRAVLSPSEFAVT